MALPQAGGRRSGRFYVILIVNMLMEMNGFIAMNYGRRECSLPVFRKANGMRRKKWD
jgi:hypothetical protein